MDEDNQPEETPKDEAPKASPARKRKTIEKPSSVGLFKGSDDADAIKALQEKLNEVLGTKLEVDGVWGGQTQSAVRRWQNENGYVGGRGKRVNQYQLRKLFNDAPDS